MVHGNYHTHTRYSDGREEPAPFVERALQLGMNQLGFTDHAPVTFPNKWSMKWEEVDQYVTSLHQLKKQYHLDIEVFTALEIDYIPGVSVPFSHFTRVMSLDYTIGGVHLVRHPDSGRLWFIDGGSEEEYALGLTTIFQDDTDLAIRSFYQQQIEMLERERPDVLAHFDKLKMHNKGRFFDDESPLVRSMQHKLLQLVKKLGTVVEVNTRGIYKGRCAELYPSERLIYACYKAGIPLMLSSDAHHPDELDGRFSETLEVLKEIGVKELVRFSNGKFVPHPF
jgi:histidinol-phosphatase (PHP family)